MAKNNNNSRWLAGEAQDILHALREKHFLLECLDSALGDIYFEASEETKESLTKIQTLFGAYDHEKAVKQLSAAIRLLDEARKAGKD